MTAEPRVAALVVLDPATLPETAARTRGAFAQAGFAVGPLVGISYSIEAPRELMESWFPDFTGKEGTGAELSLEQVPPEVAAGIQAVVSEAPPDFGPGSF